MCVIICVDNYHRNGGGAQGKEVVWVYASVGPIHFLLGHGDHPMSTVQGLYLQASPEVRL